MSFVIENMTQANLDIIEAHLVNGTLLHLSALLHGYSLLCARQLRLIDVYRRKLHQRVLELPGLDQPSFA